MSKRTARLDQSVTKVRRAKTVLDSLELNTNEIETVRAYLWNRMKGQTPEEADDFPVLDPSMYGKEPGDQGCEAKDQSESFPVHSTAVSGSDTPKYSIYYQRSPVSYSASTPIISHMNGRTGPRDAETKASPNLRQCRNLDQSSLDYVDGLAHKDGIGHLPWPTAPPSRVLPSPLRQAEYERRQSPLRLSFIPEDSIRSVTEGLLTRNDDVLGHGQHLPSTYFSGSKQECHSDGRGHYENELSSIAIEGTETLIPSIMTIDNANSITCTWGNPDYQDDIGRHDLPPRSWRPEIHEAQSYNVGSRHTNDVSPAPLNQGVSSLDTRPHSSRPWELDRSAQSGNEGSAHDPREEDILEYETQPLSSNSTARSTFNQRRTAVETSSTTGHACVSRQSSLSQGDFPLHEEIPGYQITFQSPTKVSLKYARRKWPHRSSWPCYRSNWAPKIDFTGAGSNPMDSADMREYRGTKRQRLNPGCKIWQNERDDNTDDMGDCKVDLDTVDLDPGADPHWRTEWVEIGSPDVLMLDSQPISETREYNGEGCEQPHTDNLPTLESSNDPQETHESTSMTDDTDASQEWERIDKVKVLCRNLWEKVVTCQQDRSEYATELSAAESTFTPHPHGLNIASPCQDDPVIHGRSSSKTNSVQVVQDLPGSRNVSLSYPLSYSKLEHEYEGGIEDSENDEDHWEHDDDSSLRSWRSNTITASRFNSLSAPVAPSPFVPSQPLNFTPDATFHPSHRFYPYMNAIQHTVDLAQHQPHNQNDVLAVEKSQIGRLFLRGLRNNSLHQFSNSSTSRSKPAAPRAGWRSKLTAIQATMPAQMVQRLPASVLHDNTYKTALDGIIRSSGVGSPSQDHPLAQDNRPAQDNSAGQDNPPILDCPPSATRRSLTLPANGSHTSSNAGVADSRTEYMRRHMGVCALRSNHGSLTAGVEEEVTPLPQPPTEVVRDAWGVLETEGMGRDHIEWSSSDETVCLGGNEGTAEEVESDFGGGEW